MQMAEQFDISTLAWVKGEIDETLNQARIALEAYVEDTEQPETLHTCIDLIHQVHGTLLVVELMGAALFADEVEQFASALRDGKITEQEHSHELLMRAILQLPDYLESLLDGKGDNPVVLIPLLNEMRQLRGDTQLDSVDFFLPNLTVIPPHPTSKASVDAKQAAAKLHRFYLASLAKLFKGDGKAEANLQMLGNLLERLYPSASGETWRRLLWVASAFIEGLADQSIPLDKESKLLLGKVEQQLKQVASKGEPDQQDDACASLLRKMLYRLATHNAAGKRAATIRLAFDLDSQLPSSASSLGGMNAELKKTVSADVMEELSHIKDIFDIFVRSDRNTLAQLEPMAQKLETMADTLGLLQEASLQQTLMDQQQVIKQLLAGEIEPGDDTLMGIAGAIISVESALSDWGSSAPMVMADAQDEQVANADSTPQAEAEHQRVTRQVMREAKEDLIRVREAISQYLADPAEKRPLEPLPALLHMIIGSLSLLSYRRVAQVLTSCRGFIEQELIGSEQIPQAQQLDALADAVMSVEYYLEAFIHSRVHPGSVLDVAEQAVATLGYPIGLLQEPADEEHEQEQPQVEGIEVEEADEPVASLTEALELDEELAEFAAESDFAAEPVPAPEEMAEPSLEGLEDGALELAVDELIEPEPELPEQAEAEQLSSEVTELPEEDALEEGLLSLDEESIASPVEEETVATPEVTAEATPEPVAPAPAPSPAANTRNVEVDDEIIEIFIEEAEEELANIRELLPKWVADPADGETLKTMRRSFHTLKGSGRLVGAGELGEFAWAFENMLNRVIDGTLQTNATLFDLLEQARDVIPELIDGFRNGAAANDEAEMLRQMATEIVQPGGIQAPPASPAAKAEVVAPVAATEGEQEQAEVEVVAEAEAKLTEETLPELDPVLLEIYSKESEGHLEQIEQFIQTYHEGGSRRVTEPLIRALHTIKGSSRMAGIMPVADVCAVLEKYAKTLQASSESVSEHGIEALELCRDYMLGLLAYLADREQPLPDVIPARRKAEEVFAEVQHLEEYANERPEHGLASKEEQVLEPTTPAPDVEHAEPEQEPEAEQVDEDRSWSFELLDEEPETAEEVSLAMEPEATDLAPVPPVAAEPPRPQVAETSDEEYDDELLEIFLEEGSEILDASEETLHEWVNSPDDRSLVEALQRQLHTLKGGARMAGITPVGDLSHSLESTFESINDGLIARTPEMMDLLQLSHDRLVVMLEQVRNRTPLTTGDDLIARIDALAKGLPEPVAPSATAEPVTSSEPLAEAPRPSDPFHDALELIEPQGSANGQAVQQDARATQDALLLLTDAVDEMEV